ncbi:hypothetical protein HK405_015723, partial [Cladochytrium tenue]
MLLYLYDHERVQPGDLEGLAAFTASLPHGRQPAPPEVYACPDPTAAAHFAPGGPTSLRDGPLLLAFTDGGMTRHTYRPAPKHGLSSPARLHLAALAPPGESRHGHSTPTQQGSETDRLAAWLRHRARARVPRLDAANAKSLLAGTDASLTVLTLVDSTAVHAGTGGADPLAEVRAAALAWEHRTTASEDEDEGEEDEDHDADKDGEGRRRRRRPRRQAPRRRVGFAWLDAHVWGAYAARVFGVAAGDLPRVLVVEPGRDRFFDRDGDNHIFSVTRTEVVRAAEDASMGRLKPRYTFSFLTRVLRGTAKLTDPLQDLASTGRVSVPLLLLLLLLLL